MGRDLHEIIADLKEAAIDAKPEGQSYAVPMVDPTEAAMYIADAFPSGVDYALENIADDGCDS